MPAAAATAAAAARAGGSEGAADWRCRTHMSWRVHPRRAGRNHHSPIRGRKCCALHQPRRHRTSHRSRSCHRSNSRTSRRYYRTHFGAARLSCTRMLLQSDESSHRTGCRRPHSTAASTALQVHTAIPVGIRRTGCTRAGTSYISRWSRCPRTQNAPCNQAGPTDRALPLSPMRKHRRRAQYSRRSCATSTTRGWCFQTVCHWRKMALSSRPGNSATNTQGK